GGTPTPAGGGGATLNPRRWWILTAVSLGMFMALLDVTIVNIAVPAIMADLDSTVTKVSWVLNAYNLTLAVLFLSMGVLADRWGQKRIFLFGLATFTLFSLFCGLAPNIEWLIAFRVGQAVGGAAMAPVSLAILLGVFPREKQGMAVGIWGALGTAAAAAGPSLGGILVEYFSWHWIFFVNIPIGIAAFLFALSVIPEARHTERLASEGIDVVGMGITAFGLFCLTLGLIEGNSWGWSSAGIVTLLVAAFVSYPVFVLWELRGARFPMFDFRLLRIRSFTAANSAMLAFATAMGGAFLLLVIFLVSVLGYSELRAALAMTVMPLTALVIAPNSGRLVDRIGPRYPAACGAVCMGIGLVLLAQVDAATTLSDVMWRVVFLGAGMGLTMPTISAASVGSLPPQSRGVGSGSLNMVRQIGFVLGVAILVSIFSHTATIGAATATRQAVAYVAAQQQIPEAARRQISADLVANAAQMRAGGGAGARIKDPLAGAPQFPPGSPQAQAQRLLSNRIAAIYKANIAGSFRWPFYAAALAAFIAVVPALLTGSRLGQFAGAEQGRPPETTKTGGPPTG
ncbi:MAG TPA: DHA2 family efflux MFS transporter permease subunit, partial [Thermoleophilia bacterium]|nr:DHA2 family efflux MFS transporter permease subunit [Thermoleophilia bacterium]